MHGIAVDVAATAEPHAAVHSYFQMEISLASVSLSHGPFTFAKDLVMQQCCKARTTHEFTRNSIVIPPIYRFLNHKNVIHHSKHTGDMCCYHWYKVSIVRKNPQS